MAFVPSKAAFPLYGPISPLFPSVPSTALCPLYGPLIPSYRTLFPLRPSLPSMALCPLYSNLSFDALCPLKGPLTRVDTKWRFQFFAKYDYRFLSDVIIAIIASFFA
jgi:hypothetical protein